MFQKLLELVQGSATPQEKTVTARIVREAGAKTDETQMALRATAAKIDRVRQ